MTDPLPVKPAVPRRCSCAGWRWAALLALWAPSACFSLRASSGGGEVQEPQRRSAVAADVLVPAGFAIRPVVRGLTFPTGVTFDNQGNICVLEAGYSYGEVFTTARLLCLEKSGAIRVIARGDNGPWTGVAFHEGHFYVSEGGQRDGGRILKIAPNGEQQVLVEGLPGQGDHHTNGPVVSQDGWVYFGQGTATNSGVVGPDNAQLGWLKRHPEVRDVPCRDVRLRGHNFESTSPLTDAKQRTVTGAYLPYGTPSEEGQTIPGKLPCTGAILRVRTGGGPLELVAWGLRQSVWSRAR